MISTTELNLVLLLLFEFHEQVRYSADEVFHYDMPSQNISISKCLSLSSIQ